MINPEESQLQEFSDHLSIVKKFISNFLSKSIENKKIGFNLSLLLCQPFACSKDGKNPDHISIGKILKCFIEKWKQEINYRKEIIQFKEIILAEYDKICKNTKDHNIIDCIRKERQKVVDHLFEVTNFDKSSMAGEFCRGMMNGFEIEMINKIEDYANYIFWTPQTTYLPLGLVEFIKRTFEKEVIGSPSECNILSASNKIIEYIEISTQAIEIKIEHASSGVLNMAKSLMKNFLLRTNSDIKGGLKNTLVKTQGECKNCFLLIEKFGEHDEIIKRERMKIDYILVRMEVNDFSKTNIPFFYERLELYSMSKNTKLDTIFNKLPRGLKVLQFDSRQKPSDMINLNETIKKIQTNNNELAIVFQGNENSYDQLELITNLVNHIKFHVHLIVQQFRLKFNENFQQEFQNFKIIKEFRSFELDLSSTVLNEQNLMLLNNYFENNQIQNIKSMTFVCPKYRISYNQWQLLSHLKNIITFPIQYDIENFEYTNTSVSNDEIIALSSVFECSKALKLLILDFTHASLPNEIINKFLGSLNDMNRMQHLELGFGGNVNNSASDYSIALLSKVIHQIHDLQYLNLCFWDAKHFITDSAMESLSTALMCNTKITTLYLQFRGDGNQNKITDKSMKYLSDPLQKMPNLSNLVLDFSCGNHKISQKGICLLAESLGFLQKIIVLSLIFNDGKNKVNDKGFQNLAQAIQNMKLMKQLKLNFMGGKNEVNDDGIQYLALSIKNMNGLTNLYINFGYGNHLITDKGIDKLSQSINKLKYLENLTLLFQKGKNNISDNGLNFLASSLQKTTQIAKLNLQIFGGNNKISEAGIKYLAATLPKLKFLLDFECCFIGYPNSVTRSDIQYLYSVKSYLRFESHEEVYQFSDLLEQHY